MRIAQLSPVSDEIIRDVDQTLRAELSEIGRAGSEEEDYRLSSTY